MLPNPTTVLTAAAALAVVLGLIWLMARGARLAGLGAQRVGGRSLRVVDSLALDPRRRLHLVACDQRRVLLLTGGGSDVVVGWLSRSIGDTSPEAPAEPVP